MSTDTESDKVELFIRSARSIPVVPLDTEVVVWEARRRRGRLTLATAAAVTVVVTGGAAIAISGSEPKGADPGPTPTTGTATDGRPTPLASGMPSVFGYDEEGAREVLESAGLVVDVESTANCEAPGRAVGTRPPTGSPAEAGDEVTLLVALPVVDPQCPPSTGTRAEAWEFVDFVNGRGPAPEFADTVRLYIDGAPGVQLTGDQVTDLAAWGALPAAVEENAERVLGGNPELGDLSDPTLSLTSRSGPAAPTMGCGYATPTDLVGREAVAVYFTWRTFAQYIGCDVNLLLFRTDGAIDAVVASTQVATFRMTVVPEVEGLSGALARRYLRESGFEIAQDGEPCGSATVVESQSPSSEIAVRFGITVTLTCRP